MQNKVQLTTRSNSRGGVEASPVASKRVLVADEDPALLRRVTESIDRDGFRAVPACDGQEALKILQRDSDFVAAIFAVAMSDIQGPELVRYMKTERRLMHIPHYHDELPAEPDPLGRRFFGRRSSLPPQTVHSLPIARDAAHADR